MWKPETPFGLFADLAKRQGLTVNKVLLAPSSGVSLACFVNARCLVQTPYEVETLDVDQLDEDSPLNGQTENTTEDEQRGKDAISKSAAGLISNPSLTTV